MTPENATKLLSVLEKLPIRQLLAADAIDAVNELRSIAATFVSKPSGPVTWYPPHTTANKDQGQDG